MDPKKTRPIKINILATEFVMTHISVIFPSLNSCYVYAVWPSYAALLELCMHEMVSEATAP